MTLYKVRKGNIEFFIQPYMIQDYSDMGYEVIKLEETPVKNIQSEMDMVSDMMEGTYERS